jgi:hypothetical protein
MYIMIQVYKEAFKARATSFRARRVAFVSFTVKTNHNFEKLDIYNR